MPKIPPKKQLALLDQVYSLARKNYRKEAEGQEMEQAKSLDQELAEALNKL